MKQLSHQIKIHDTNSSGLQWPHCGMSESEITFFVEPCSGGHSSFDDREELENEALEIPTGEFFAFSTVEMDLLCGMATVTDVARDDTFPTGLGDSDDML